MPLDLAPPEWFRQLGPIAWPLAVCSIIVFAVCLERVVFTLRSRWGDDAAFRRLADSMILHRSLPKPLRDDVGAMMLHELERSYLGGVKVLRIIGTVSPMLGLLGTILGIISAFRAIAAQTGPVSPNMIAEGLWEAMLTTAVGLMISLPALLAAHLFKHVGERQIDNLALRLNRLSLSFEIEDGDVRGEGGKRPVKGIAA